MHKGDVSAKANLADFKSTKNLYAIGAFENLKGEIQILNGTPYNTSVVDSALAFDASFNKKATLLVYATVHKWTTITIPATIHTYEELETYVATAAKKHGIDTTAPFPFLVEGTAELFDWHVINWKDGDTVHTHEKHIHSGLYGTLHHTPVKMLGFYSDAHHAIFTHHTTNMHIHVKTNDNTVAGHLDGLVLGKDMVLKLPNM